MVTTELDHKLTTPIDIQVHEAEDQVVITMPLLPFDCESGTGKMNVLATTNGWLKTQVLCPRTAKQIDVQIFVGTKKK